MKALRIAVTFSLFILLLAVPAVSQVPDDLLIVPGQRIGRVKLDNSMDEVIQLFGPPSSVSEISGCNVLEGDDALPVTTYWWKRVALIVATRDRTKIEYMFVDRTVESLTRAYKTAQGIGRDVGRDIVERVYGQPTARTFCFLIPNVAITRKERWIYDKDGLFVSMLGETVQTLGVFWPGEAKNNWKF